MVQLKKSDQGGNYDGQLGDTPTLVLNGGETSGQEEKGRKGNGRHGGNVRSGPRATQGGGSVYHVKGKRE